MIDCHVHSSFSGDSSMDAVAACNTAIARGLGGVIFTDHLDYDFPDFSDEFLIDFDLYNTYMDNLKQKMLPGFKALKGIEVGIQPHVINDTLEVVKSYDFDYVLASVHIVAGGDPYKAGYYSGKTKLEAYSEYLQEISFMIGSFTDFDALGHLDFIIRKACYDDRSLLYDDHSDLIDGIFRKLIQDGRGIEINTGSYRDLPGIKTASFDQAILKRYRELGGEIITLGSDSHTEEYLGYKFGYFRQMVSSAGIQYIAHFENRKPVFEKI